jgi:hypothetical protein
MTNEQNADAQDSTVTVHSETQVILRVNLGPFMLAKPKPAEPRPPRKP